MIDPCHSLDGCLVGIGVEYEFYLSNVVDVDVVIIASTGHQMVFLLDAAYLLGVMPGEEQAVPIHPGIDATHGLVLRPSYHLAAFPLNRRDSAGMLPATERHLLPEIIIHLKGPTMIPHRNLVIKG